MKTYEVETTKQIKSKVLVRAESKTDAREAVKSGNVDVESFTVSQAVSNTVNTVKEV